LRYPMLPLALVALAQALVVAYASRYGLRWGDLAEALRLEARRWHTLWR